ncbi:uncharacterized protein LOC126322594 [Schistocerca gregaria]|uniref:uncharacterized protein LOC126322594 n=1 Tax=Schistocerca gregaria TaxID=7010 RepID=UPI00211F254B|nr:uncharacterized protein LOC126322594 [Schistocerca gregaria]
MDNISQDRRCILDVLPCETLELIIQQIGPITNSWPVLSRVCKTMYSLALSSRLWRQIEFHNMIFSNETYQICARNMQHQYMYSIDLHRCSGLTIETLRKFSEFKRLERMAIRYSSLTESLDFSIRMSNFPPVSNEIGGSAPIGGSTTHGKGGEDIIEWPESLKFLNLTNFNGSRIFSLVKCNNLESLYLSGAQGNASEILNWLLNSKKTLREVDVSRTTFRQEQVSILLQSCPKLELLVATEVMQRAEEENYSKMYPNVQLLFDLLSHKIDPINARKKYITALYDVDGKGCSLLADGIYVGMEMSALRHIVKEFNIDPNKCRESPSPWKIPFPMKHLTSIIRFPLALHQAAAFFEIETVRFLLEIGTDPNLKCPENSGRTALSLSMSNIVDSHQCLQLCSFLVEHGALLDVQDDDGKTPIDYAIESKKFNLLCPLIADSIQAPLPTHQLNLIMYAAIENDCLKLYQVCIQRGADVSIPNAAGYTHLNWAIRHQSLAVAKYILSQNMEEINRLDELNGWAPIHYALLAINGGYAGAILEVLIESGCDLKIKTRSGQSLRQFMSEKHISSSFLMDSVRNAGVLLPQEEVYD